MHFLFVIKCKMFLYIPKYAICPQTCIIWYLGMSVSKGVGIDWWQNEILPCPPFTPVRGQSIPFWCRRKAYRWEINFSQSALWNVQSRFWSCPVHQNTISPMVWQIADMPMIMSTQPRSWASMCEGRSRPELSFAGPCQYWMQTGAFLDRLVSRL